MSFKPIDGKRDDYRKYLERSGVIEALSKVLVNLYNEPERPENAIDYLRMNFGDTLKDNDIIESLKNELADAKREIGDLTERLFLSNNIETSTNGPGGDGSKTVEISTNNNIEDNEIEIAPTTQAIIVDEITKPEINEIEENKIQQPNGENNEPLQPESDPVINNEENLASLNNNNISSPSKTKIVETKIEVVSSKNEVVASNEEDTLKDTTKNLE